MTTIIGPSIYIRAVSMAGRTVVITFKVKRDLIEVFESSPRTQTETNLAVIDRDDFIRWLSEPSHPFRSDDLTLEIDYGLDRESGRLAITTRDVLLWALSPTEEYEFTRHLG
jgi:hypothetical protein